VKIQVSKSQIRLRKELNDLDRLVIDFISILDKSKVRYVLVSGYVSILFGRSRSSEDIDVIVGKISKNKFSALWKGLSKKNFQCLNTDNFESAYDKYLLDPRFHSVLHERPTNTKY